LRRTLVIFQFFIAVAIITSTAIVLKQVRFSETTDLGFDQENLIVVRNRSAYRMRNADLIKKEIQNRTGAISVAAVGWFPHDQNRNIMTFHPQDRKEEKGIVAQTMDFDADFVSTLGLSIIEGRNFEEGRVADGNAVLINRKAIETFGFTEPVGSVLFNDDEAYRVIGVLEDWHTNSIHSGINPTVAFLTDETAAEFVVRIKPEQSRETLTAIREIWNRLMPQTILDYVYVTDLLNRSYDGERRLASLLVSFGILTIVVACLGIYGLASYVTEQRTKEIGIRKVLGATVSGVIFILSKQFIFWIVVANVFAWPTVYFLMKNWLQRFAYRTPIEWWIFLLAGLGVFTAALATVGIQSLRAARANPVDALRYE
jgi:putative ABC transport system permease protein